MLLWLIFEMVSFLEGNPDAKMLYNDLLRKNGYNKLIRPVGNNSDKLTVKLGLKLSQLIDVVSRKERLEDFFSKKSLFITLDAIELRLVAVSNSSVTIVLFRMKRTRL